MIRQEVTPTLHDCIAWFNNISHSFDDKQVKKACEDVMNKHLTSVTMESFSAKTAAGLAAEILQLRVRKFLLSTTLTLLTLSVLYMTS